MARIVPLANEDADRADPIHAIERAGGLSEQIVSARRKEEEWADAARKRCPIPLALRGRLTDFEKLRIGVCGHELAHAAVLISCGNVADHVAIIPDGAVGRGYMRYVVDHGGLVARMAVLLAGMDGFASTTGDVYGAYRSGAWDRDDMEACLEHAGLMGRSKGAAIDLAQEIVHRVLSDEECWDSIVELAIELMRRGSGRIDGEEVHARLVIPYRTRLDVARLIGDERTVWCGRPS